MKKALLSILFIQMIFLSLAPTAFSQCGRVADDLSLVLPCVEYGGQYYKLNFSAYTNPADGWLYWRYESIQLASGGTSCAHADAALAITAPCVYYAGYNIAITLEYSPGINPAEPNWPYWKLSPQLTLNPVTIKTISGDTTELLLPYYSSPEFQASLMAAMTCIQQCNPTDPACIMNCMPDLGLGSAFSLAFELCNPGISPIEFCLPAGAYFDPGTGDVQPMLIGIDQCLVVPPEECKIFLVPTYCMDGGASAPDSEDVYSISGAGIAQQACIAEILDLISDKTEISHGDSYIIQDAIWGCTEFGSITEDQRTALQNM
ncbi:MAG: hypothetical protein GWP07_06210 [Xanthomonadaceae bacterium]|nr:hypothetical protein [Xanthomonadaceae bacterium]